MFFIKSRIYKVVLSQPNSCLKNSCIFKTVARHNLVQSYFFRRTQILLPRPHHVAKMSLCVNHRGFHDHSPNISLDSLWIPQDSRNASLFMWKDLIIQLLWSLLVRKIRLQDPDPCLSCLSRLSCLSSSLGVTGKTGRTGTLDVDKSLNYFNMHEFFSIYNTIA